MSELEEATCGMSGLPTRLNPVWVLKPSIDGNIAQSADQLRYKAFVRTPPPNKKSSPSPFPPPGKIVPPPNTIRPYIIPLSWMYSLIIGDIALHERQRHDDDALHRREEVGKAASDANNDKCRFGIRDDVDLPSMSVSSGFQQVSVVTASASCNYTYTWMNWCKNSGNSPSAMNSFHAWRKESAQCTVSLPATSKVFALLLIRSPLTPSLPIT